MFAFGGELFTRGISYTEDISSELDRHDLRTETDSEVGDIFLSRILSCHDHPLCSTSTKSSWDTDTIESIEKLGPSCLDVLRFDKFDLDLSHMSISSTLESLIERVVCILKSDVFPDHGNS